MKLKYAIIATIIFNLVLISIFLCRQYKEYHNRKHDYIRIIEASKAKIIKEIENIYSILPSTQRANGTSKRIWHRTSLHKIYNRSTWWQHLRRKYSWKR